MTLVPMSAGRAVAEDYCATGLSLRGHPLAFLRADLAVRGYRPCRVLDAVRHGRDVRLAGLVLMPQLRAAFVRSAPSSTGAIASIRRAARTLPARDEAARSCAAVKSARVTAMLADMINPSASAKKSEKRHPQNPASQS